jgi:hypothetical protein
MEYMVQLQGRFILLPACPAAEGPSSLCAKKELVSFSLFPPFFLLSERILCEEKKAIELDGALDVIEKNRIEASLDLPFVLYC